MTPGERVCAQSVEFRDLGLEVGEIRPVQLGKVFRGDQITKFA
jgi:hypothetical protein